MWALLRSRVGVVLPTMVVIQAFGTMCSFAGAVVVVRAAEPLGVEPTRIGVYTAVLYVVAMLSGLASGGLLVRFGVIRTCQGCLLAAALGLLLAAAAPAWPVALLAAVLIGSAMGPLNPAGSLILAHHAPAVWLPFVFSVKQTGTPIGGMLAGLLLPPLIALYDWRLALAALAVIPLVTLLGLQGLRPGLDEDRDPTRRLGLDGVRDALRVVLTCRPLAILAAAGLVYTFVQMAILSFMVIFLSAENGLSTAFAGGVFAIIHGSAVPARVFWGAIAGRLVTSWILLGAIGLMMAAGILAMSFFTPDWPFWATAAVAVVLGASTNGVLGLLLVEFARLAPGGRIGEATGGGQFFLFFGIVTGPPLFALVVEQGGGYMNAFHMIAGLALLAGLGLLATARFGRGA